MSEENGSGTQQGQRAGAFDIRLVIAALFVLYGAICTLMGLLGTSEEDIRQAAGININLWSGLGMLVFAGAFTIWARARPIVLPADSETPSS